ncbi:MAG: hypothetical protein COZ27_01575, partial [Candidatus Moranbacteria bacterium CG_4_10_14_3_um_filter_41_65]
QILFTKYSLKKVPSQGGQGFFVFISNNQRNFLITNNPSGSRSEKFLRQKISTETKDCFYSENTINKGRE